MSYSIHPPIHTNTTQSKIGSVSVVLMGPWGTVDIGVDGGNGRMVGMRTCIAYACAYDIEELTLKGTLLPVNQSLGVW